MWYDCSALALALSPSLQRTSTSASLNAEETARLVRARA